MSIKMCLPSYAKLSRLEHNLGHFTNNLRAALTFSQHFIRKCISIIGADCRISSVYYEVTFPAGDFESTFNHVDQGPL